jgi:hypothetical protein
VFTPSLASTTTVPQLNITWGYSGNRGPALTVVLLNQGLGLQAVEALFD